MDLHVDTFGRLRELGGDFLGERPDLQVDPVRCRAGGVGLLLGALFTRDDDPDPGASVDGMLGCLDRSLAHPESPLRRVGTLDEYERVPADRIAVLPTIENARALGGDLGRLERWRERGIRIIGLTWNGAGELGCGAASVPDSGLTRLGREAVIEARRLGLAIDVSHLSPRSLGDVLAVDAELIATHSNARAIHDHPRNLSDVALRALRERGAVIGLTLYPPFLAGRGDDPIAALARHALHLAAVVGWEAIGLGSDLDGIDELPAGFRGHQDLPILERALDRAGFGASEIAGIRGENFIRWWRRALPPR